MHIDVRPTTDSEWRAAADTFRGALLFGASTDDDWQMGHLVTSWRECDSFSAWDGDRCVGHAGAFRFTTVVPGGAVLPTAGITRVGVRQTHTRQGLLTRMMTQLLTTCRENGQVLSSLRASQAVIYGRFGFGLAADDTAIQIDVRRPLRVIGPVAGGSVEMLPPQQVMEVVPALHDRVGLSRPGAIVRPMWMHERYLEDATTGKDGAQVVVHRSPSGELDGYVAYRTEWPEVFGESNPGIAVIDDLWAVDVPTELALWRYVLDLDLIGTVRAEERPVDDAIRFALDDIRRYEIKQRWDEQWVRLLDVDAALRARRYNAAQRPVTVAVHDPMFPDNDGTWLIGADGADRIGRQRADDADLHVDIATLGAAYLGGTSWWELAAAGRVDERRAGAVADADLLFSSIPRPACGSFF